MGVGAYIRCGGFVGLATLNAHGMCQYTVHSSDLIRSGITQGFLQSLMQPGTVATCAQLQTCMPLQLSEPIKAYLQQAEEAARASKEEQRHALWDDKMRATQTQSAYGVRVT